MCKSPDLPSQMAPLQEITLPLLLLQENPTRLSSPWQSRNLDN